MLKYQRLTDYEGQKYRAVKTVDGWECLKEVPPEGWEPEYIRPAYDEAWKIKMSGGWPVWQYQSQRFGRELR